MVPVPFALESFVGIEFALQFPKLDKLGIRGEYLVIEYPSMVLKEIRSSEPERPVDKLAKRLLRLNTVGAGVVDRQVCHDACEVLTRPGREAFVVAPNHPDRVVHEIRAVPVETRGGQFHEARQARNGDVNLGDYQRSARWSSATQCGSASYSGS